MTLDLFVHPSGRLAIRPLLDPGENLSIAIRLLSSVPCRRWHPSERLWTMSIRGPGIGPLERLLNLSRVLNVLETESPRIDFLEESGDALDHERGGKDGLGLP